MKLQAGKFYRTRSGSSVAYIAATRCPLRHSERGVQAIGWLLIDDEDTADVHSWAIDGNFRRSTVNSPLDLVAEHIFECKEGCGPCGVDIFTPINREGPYCPKCLERESEQESADNGQFGVGA